MQHRKVVTGALSLVLSMLFTNLAIAESAVAEQDATQQSAATTNSIEEKSVAGEVPVSAQEPLAIKAKKAVSVQDNRLMKEMVVSAKKDTPVQQRTELGKLTVYTPVSGAVVSEEELEHLQVQNNLLELGKRVPGISMIRNMRIPDGGKQYTESRIDGMRTTSLNTSTFDTIDLSAIERIDVITGPASALYGTGALGGTISLTSRQPSEQLTARVSQELGSWGFQRTQARASTSLAQGKVGLIVTGSAMDFDGWRNNGAPVNTDSAAEHKNGGGIKAYLRPAETTKVVVGYDKLHYDYRWAGTLPWDMWQQDWRQTYPGAYGQSIDDYTTKQIRLQQFIGNKGELNIAYGVIDDDGINYGGAGSGGANNVICDDGTSAANAVAPVSGATVICRAVNNNSRTVTNTLKSGTTKVTTRTFMYRHEFDTARATLHVGNDNYESVSESSTYANTYNALQAQSGFWAKGAMTSAGSITTQNDNSPFIHLEMSPTDKVRLHIGDRIAKVTYTTDDRTATNKDGEVTKKGSVVRSGITYELTPDHIVWGNIGQTFNPPSVSSTQDSAATGTPGRTLAADLNPEKGLTREIGFRGKFDDQSFQYDITFYHVTINDYQTTRACTAAEQVLLNPDGSPTGATCNVNENAGQMTSKGMESMLSWAANDWLDLGVTYVNARAYWDNYVSGGTDKSGLSYQALPRNRVDLRVAVRPAPGWQAELEGDYIASYYVNNENTDTYARPDIYTLRASYRDKNWSWWLHVINLTDTHYATRVSHTTVAGLTQKAASAGQGNSGSYLPRTFRAGVAYHF
jgi:outer membrane receptor protein involved in Fe transport